MATSRREVQPLHGWAGTSRLHSQISSTVNASAVRPKLAQGQKVAQNRSEWRLRSGMDGASETVGEMGGGPNTATD